jgi:hypothetical protein
VFVYAPTTLVNITTRRAAAAAPSATAIRIYTPAYSRINAIVQAETALECMIKWVT